MTYETLAEVYDFLIPDDMVTPAGSAAAHDDALAGLAAGGHVLDCSCGSGLLAVGLAQAGFQVSASDISPEMVERTRALAEAHDAAVETRVCAWDNLTTQGWSRQFDAVLCVGNSLTHAPGRDGRRSALRGMESVLADEGVLVLTSRNWEFQLEHAQSLLVGERIVERDGRRGVVVYDWLPTATWSERHLLDIAVILLDPDGVGVRTHTERLAYWPFTPNELAEDLASAGLEAADSTFQPNVDRYSLIARRRSG